MLDHFDRYRAFGKYSNNPKMPINERGQSELFRRDTLGLDEDLYNALDKETLKAIYEKHEDTKAGCLFFLIGLVGLIFVPFTAGLSLALVLIALLLGAMGMFGQTNRSLPKLPRRPVHPPEIQELINALLIQSKTCSQAAL